MAQVQIIEKAKGRIDRSNGRIINGPIRVAAYARVSTDMQDQKNSYASQLKYYTDKINSNPKWIPTKVYADEDEKKKHKKQEIKSINIEEKIFCVK